MTIRPTFVEDVHQSIIKWGIDFINRPDIMSIAGETIEYHVWDAWADQTDYPDKNLFGHSAFSMDTDGLTAAINFSYGLSFIQDKNLNRHVKLMSRLLSELAPGNTIPVVDGRDSLVDEESWLFIGDETQILPVVKSTLRPVQFIMVTTYASPLLLGHTLEEIEQMEAQMSD